MLRLRKRPEPADAGPDLKGLEKFLQDGGRGEPVHFAGRKADIRAMEGLLANVRDKGAGLTRVIKAAPGAGKTSLLRELKARWEKSKVARPVLLEAPDFSDPAQVIGAMLYAIDKNAANRFGVTEARSGGHLSRYTQRTNLPTTFSDALSVLEDRETPVLLLVDEAHLWGTDEEIGDQRISHLLLEAHLNQQRLPLLIVAAGVGDAAQAVTERSGSRLSTGSRVLLGPLSDEEMREVCVKFFERFGIAGSDPQRAEWTDALISDTGGWPRHLTNALRGAAQALIEGSGDLSRSSLEAAREGGRGFRREFYREQIEPFQRMPELLAAVFGAMPESEGATGAALRAAINQAYEETPDLADEMAKPEVFAKLLHRGLIQEFGENDYNCPIPSMRTYVEEFCAEHGTPVGRGDPVSHTGC